MQMTYLEAIKITIR